MLYESLILDSFYEGYPAYMFRGCPIGFYKVEFFFFSCII